MQCSTDADIPKVSPYDFGIDLEWLTEARKERLLEERLKDWGKYGNPTGFEAEHDRDAAGEGLEIEGDGDAAREEVIETELLMTSNARLIDYRLRAHGLAL